MDKKEFKGFFDKEYAPVVRDESADFLYHFCVENKPKNVLEIGTFIGYSGCLILSANNDTKLTTVEINEDNYKNAISNFNEYGFKDRVNVFLGDAKEVIEKLLDENKKYDLIFLDGPKGQYMRYLPTLKKLLLSNGYLIADNVYFHGLVLKNGHIEHKHRTIVNNLRTFLNMIKEDKDFSSEVLNIGDGISISKKF